MQIKSFYILVFLFFISLSGYSQYRIHGYLETNEKIKTIYLSLLRFNEENAIYPEQVLITTQTDSTGYFEIIGKLLPDENKLYRIHSNINESDPLLEFVETGKNKNHLNFIFSNNDTLFFPKGKSIWFNEAQNTNLEDKEWRRSISYELKLLEEYSKAKNIDAIVQAEEKFLSEYKTFCVDSLSGSLVKLMGYAHLRGNADITQDYKNDPDFYNNLLNELNKDYGGASYYTQFQDVIARLSASVITQKYLFHKRLNFVLGGLIILLLGGLLYLSYLFRRRSKQEVELAVSALTGQEEKIVKLICEGKSNKEIASILFVSLSTVKSHIGNINSKLNVTSRKQLLDKFKNHTGY